ncbi:MAG: 1-deoxy-D-xylulose-5-phosphate synthase, partial [Oscillospiraceae bacterium]|nr:1-deoxy-D-xylulose-5-phosphate synthase [Oscillospiraceae bacterium]
MNETKLEKIDLPGGLKDLSIEECRDLCKDIRNILIRTVSKNGGHLASNLGVVELTLAIHRVFNSPDDKIVWDVGHQAYTHKILTGRLDRFSTLRQENGISGFPKPNESEHDAFVSGHSSTSISVACGIAEAMKLENKNNHAVAVIGDGAFTGGLAYEGLNNAGKSHSNLIVILNHNGMSISKNVGALAKYLSAIRNKEGYMNTKNAVDQVLKKTPVVGQPISKVLSASKSAIKGAVLKGSNTMFEDLGFEYLGPVDGHDIEAVEEVLKVAQAMHKPVFVHVNTIKGKGYTPAEKNPGEYHGIPRFDIATGNPEVSSVDSFSSEFGRELAAIAGENDKLCAVTAAMKYGTGLQFFAAKYKERFFDVGIAEQHAVTYCAGLASMGMVPVFAVYSSFLQRAYDQIVHDAALSGCHMVIGIDRAGFVGEDGETHQGVFDVPMLTSVPGVTIFSPSGYD